MSACDGQPEVFCDQNIHVIRIDPDTPLTLEGQVPLETNLDEIPGNPASRNSSDFRDRIRYNEYEYGLEKKYFEPYRLSPARQTVVRCHRDVNSVVREIFNALDRNGSDSFLFGMDTEKEGSTLQTSILIEGPSGKVAFEKHVLWKIKTTRCIKVRFWRG